ncbi:MAG: redoxin domain-containing protein [Rhodospirillaceae bacterium]|nr:MAG: redoxin domain-containing protein [Rhodospirillaceae bacterium]
MQAVSIGPFIFAGDRLAAIVGIGVFMIVTTILAVRVDRRFGSWSTLVLVAGLVAARLGHVIEHAGSFAAEPLRIFAVWQGGFSWAWATIAVAIVSVLYVRSLRFGLWSAFALGLSLIAWNTVWQLTTAIPATPMSATVLEHLDGRRMSLAEPGHKPVVINLWATWCPPCRRELPMMAEVAAATNDVAFMFVNQGEGRAAIEAYLAAAGLSLDGVLLDPLRTVSRHYGTPGLPVTLFIGADGRLRSAHVGEISRETLTNGLSRLKAE